MESKGDHGAEAGHFLALYAALKRRSSTMVQAFEQGHGLLAAYVLRHDYTRAADGRRRLFPHEL
jgi:hypothetical protein